jgi:hypothetical protein
MSLLTRRPQLSAEEIAAARQAEVRADVDRARQLDALQRERAAADRAERRRAEREAERAERKRRKAKAKAKARRRATLRRWADSARTIAPLLLVNTAAVGGQTAYGFTRTSESWPIAARLVVALVYAATVESISLYVNWHSHDALIQGATGTAAEMRRRAYVIAAVVAALNYSHFDGEDWRPTPFAVGSGMSSLLSPWLWGLHTRRQQHLQLLRKDLVDETGAVFDRKRKRAFPIRTWRAERWSIEHHVRDPKVAWDGCHAERAERRAARPTGRLRAAWAALLGRTGQPTSATPAEPAEPDRQCAELLEQVATARARLSSGAAWAVRRRSDLGPARPLRAAEALASPAEADRSAPAELAGPETAEVPAQLPIPGVPAEPPAEVDPDEPSRASRGPGRPVVGARLAEEYDRLAQKLGRRPSGLKLARAAGCGLTTAKDWMRQNRPRSA